MIEIPPHLEEIAINIKSLSKSYSLGGSAYDNLRAKFGRRSYMPPVHQVLHDISLQIRRGETVGLLGVNGAGKSTLLQLVTGTLTPTTGTIAINGRVSALLELGAGFNPEWTGRQNSEFYCVIHGVAANRLTSHLAEIEAFADIGGFFDEPMRTYSSGMFLRVAFAASISIDPEILIVDEALAVGDARFQNKCFAHFQGMQKAGKTILFVTHDVELMTRFCTRGVVLDMGRMEFDGPPAEAVSRYISILFGNGAPSAASSEPGAATTAATGNAPDASHEAYQFSLTAAVSAPTFSWPPNPTALSRRAFYNSHERRVGEAQDCIIDVQFLDKKSRPVHADFVAGETVSVAVQIVASRAVAAPSYGISIKSIDNTNVYGTTNILLEQDSPALRVGEALVVTFTMSLALMSGTYFIDVGFAEAKPSLTVIDWRISVASFTIRNPNRGYGFADLGVVMTTEQPPTGALLDQPKNVKVSPLQ